MAERKTVKRKSRRPYRGTFRATTTGRVVNSCEVIGIQKRYDPKKTYYFVIMVKWSDRSELIIYRTLASVNQLIGTIQKKIPKDIRADCEEPVRAMQKCTLQKASLSHHLKMLAHLNKLYEAICYSSALKANTKIVDHITSSKRDLLGSSETTTVTLMVIFHDQLIPAQGNLRRSVAAIKSEKIEDDWHTVVESFEPEDTSPNSEELPVKVGDVVNVLVKTPNGWWFVESDDQHGWVPGTYLEATYATSKPQRKSPPSADDAFMAGKTFITRERYGFYSLP